MDEKTLALLGDRAAQERLTAAGVLLPCPVLRKQSRNWTGLYYLQFLWGNNEQVGLFI